MRKTTAIVLLFSFLFSNTEIHEFIGAPALLNHFFEHQKSDTLLSWVDFLKIHYSQQNDEDAHEHNKLPFKSDCHSTYTLLSFIISENYTFHYQLAVIANEKVTYSYIIPTSVFLSNIWQPPKIS